MNLREIRIKWMRFLEKILPYFLYDFLTDWVIPPYYKFRKFLGFERYDIVKLPTGGRLQYADVRYRVTDAVFALFCEFIEKEHPFNIICYDDSYVMKLKDNYKDIIFNGDYDIYEDEIVDGNKIKLDERMKDIYSYIKFERILLDNDRSVLLGIWCKFHDFEFEPVEGKPDCCTLKDVWTEFSFEKLTDFEKNVYSKYIPNDKIGDLKYLNNTFKYLEHLIEQKDHESLIDIIKIKDTLWT